MQARLDAAVLELPAELESIAPAVDAVGDCAKRGGLDPEGTQKIVLAVCEAVTNIITHALASDPRLSFRVFFGGAGDALVVRCEDEGPLFDPQELPPVDLAAPLALRPIGGLGWVLIDNACDEVRMERVANTNVLTLVRRRQRSETADAAG